MDYLVTGGAGFIGSNICTRLVEKNFKVRVLDNLSTGKAENLDPVKEKIDFVCGDIRDEEIVRKSVKGVKFVIHTAALPSVARSVEDPVTSNDVNIRGTLNVLVAARDAGVERAVFSSSSSVYGDTDVLPKKEDMAPKPLSPYAVQKQAGETYFRIFYELYGLRTFALRYFNVFGPHQNPKSQYAAVIPIFINMLLTGKQPVIHGDGGQTRDFTFVDDVVNANLRCCEAPDDAAGGIYNIARGDRISVKEVAEMIGKMLKKKVSPVYDTARPGDVRDSQADPRLAEKMLGWHSETTFEAGLEKTVEYYSRNRF